VKEVTLSDEIVEADLDKEDSPDPDAQAPVNRDVVTQHYDLVVSSLLDQIKTEDIILRPSFQRGYVWPNRMASKLIESIVLNVPIPPCFLAQNDEFELDVVDGQQRLETIRRYVANEFPLSGLTMLPELNGKRFHHLPTKTQRQIKTHTVRCIMITNKSHPDVKFDIFERLNSNTSSLNAQELRNCIYRGSFNNLLRDLAGEKAWLSILGRKSADKRMRGEEVILRFFAYELNGLESYRTPLKNWLNDAASKGKKLDDARIEEMRLKWSGMLVKTQLIFAPSECFRRPKSRPINKALFDLISQTTAHMETDDIANQRDQFRKCYFDLLANEEFDDLISRAVDHKKRTQRRFELWNIQFAWLG
jgi:hypothetical protein